MVGFFDGVRDDVAAQPPSDRNEKARAYFITFRC